MKKVLLVYIFLCQLLAAAQNPDHISIDMEDGITLKADLYRQDTSAKGSVILIRTPYRKEGMKPIAEYFASHGYIVLVQDVRGKYSSQGNFVPFLRELADGEATLSWLSQQEWNNGNIGLWGSSYLGFNSLSLSASENSYLKSIFHISGWLDGTKINSPGGAFHQSLVIPWLIFEGQQLRKDMEKKDLEEILSHTPTSEALPNSFFLLENGDSIHLSKLNIDNQTFPFESSRVPIFHLTGWYDFVLSGVLSAYGEFSKRSKANQYLKIGPWYHNQAYGNDNSVGDYPLPPNSQTNIEKLLAKSIAWFDYTLKGKNFNTPTVEYYILFEDEWANSNSWPPTDGSCTKIYLTDKSLVKQKSNPNSSSSFIYNPEKPVPTWGGANFHFFMDAMGVREQSKIESRSDVLTFTSSAFKSSKTFAGPIELEFYYTTEGHSTDFTAKLTLVDKNDQSWNVSEGIVRISNTTKNEVDRAQITLNDVAFQVKKGWKLRIQISSSNFPKFNRNPNTGVDPMDASSFMSVKQTIYHGKKYPTHIKLFEIIR